MHRLRTARHLARLVLVWFALSIGVAIASPMVHPQEMELICTGTGAMKVLVKTADGVKEVSSHTLDCPLCASVGALSTFPRVVFEPVQPLGHVLRPVPAAHIAWLTAAPLPARGPPSHS
ncbi:MAG: DUF2946 domain-containing protein [Ramlibacter sp.]|nr:DUF2946 domain-containing protein [Ramlibacter sp.]MBX3660478.1 DUF2946 domain-containing protein [Ramlibacter sp.]